MEVLLLRFLLVNISSPMAASVGFTSIDKSLVGTRPLTIAALLIIDEKSSACAVREEKIRADKRRVKFTELIAKLMDFDKAAEFIFFLFQGFYTKH